MAQAQADHHQVGTSKSLRQRNEHEGQDGRASTVRYRLSAQLEVRHKLSKNHQKRYPIEKITRKTK